MSLASSNYSALATTIEASAGSSVSTDPLVTGTVLISSNSTPPGDILLRGIIAGSNITVGTDANENITIAASGTLGVNTVSDATGFTGQPIVNAALTTANDIFLNTVKAGSGVSVTPGGTNNSDLTIANTGVLTAANATGFSGLPLINAGLSSASSKFLNSIKAGAGVTIAATGTNGSDLLISAGSTPYSNAQILYLDASYTGTSDGTAAQPYKTFDAFDTAFLALPNGFYVLNVAPGNYTYSNAGFYAWPIDNNTKSLSAVGSTSANVTTLSFDIHFIAPAGSSPNYQVQNIALTGNTLTNLSAATGFYSISYVNGFISGHDYTGNPSVPGIAGYVKCGVGQLIVNDGGISALDSFLLGPVTVTGTNSNFYMGNCTIVSGTIALGLLGNLFCTSLVQALSPTWLSADGTGCRATLDDYTLGQLTYTPSGSDVVLVDRGIVPISNITFSTNANGTLGIGGVSNVTDVSTTTFTNKTLTSTTNNVSAKSLHSATTTVDVFAAAAPTANQVLTATSGSAATWQNSVTATSADSFSNKTIVDAVTNNVTARSLVNTFGGAAVSTYGSNVPSIGQVLTADSTTTAIWSTPAISSFTPSSTDTLTNKTIIATSNNVAAKSLLSATTAVDTFAGAAPTSGQVLTATSGTAATWQNPVTGVTGLDGLTDAYHQGTALSLTQKYSGSGNNTIHIDNSTHAGESGNSNTSIGIGSLANITTGFNNVILGAAAANNLTTGGNNIIIGGGANVPGGAGAASLGRIAIGNTAIATVDGGLNFNTTLTNVSGATNIFTFKASDGQAGPLAAGSTGQVLTQGASSISWASPAGATPTFSVFSDTIGFTSVTSTGLLTVPSSVVVANNWGTNITGSGTTFTCNTTGFYQTDIVLNMTMISGIGNEAYSADFVVQKNSTTINGLDVLPRGTLFSQVGQMFYSFSRVLSLTSGDTLTVNLQTNSSNRITLQWVSASFIKL
jgi:hypothetical protein